MQNLYSDIYLKNVKSSIYEADFVNAAAWLISRHCIGKVGGFNPSFFHYGEDDNYVQRLKFHSFKLGVLPTANIFHDREIASQDNMYFQNEKLIYERTLVLKFSNPYGHYSFPNEYKTNIVAFVKSVFALKARDMKKSFLKIMILSQLDKKNILENKNESKKIKSSFLK